MFPANITTLAEEVLDQARARGLMVAAAESCTGGLVLGALTAIAGSSDVVAGGIVSYSNAAKEALLSVPHDALEHHGAVSEPVARAMAEGAAWALKADLAVSITGVAGPGGGSADKPVGMVCFVVAGGAETLAWTEQFGDLGREQVRLASVERALSLLLERILGRA